MSAKPVSEDLILPKALPVGGEGRTATAWWGLWTLVLTEASLFGYLFLCYFYLLFQTHPSWPPEGPPNLTLPGLNTVILLSSSVFAWLAERQLKNDSRPWCLACLGTAIALGAAFVAIQLKEWSGKPYDIASNLYGSLFFTITGFHMLHVVVGLIVLSLLFVWIAIGRVHRDRPVALSVGGVYWHFVDAVWIVVFSSLYLMPYVVGR